MTPSIQPRLVVEDVDATIAYYEQYLGATKLFRHAEPSGVVVQTEVQIGDSTVLLTQALDEYRPWGKREGRIRDPFGHLWLLSQDLPVIT